MRRQTFRRRLAAGIAAAALLVSAPAASAATTTTTATSSNWAGYVATGTTFSSVSGSWVVPTAKEASEGYEATWVGLGGAGDSSEALEQVGTESDYVNGEATYSAWYELVPKAPVTLKLAVHPGDHITAKVTVTGTTVKVSLANTTTGKSVSRTLHMSDPDTSSAEWVAEAPSAQSRFGTQVLPLSDFGKVTFTSASATANGHTGGITDANWTTEKVDLAGDMSAATTSSLKQSGTAFSVSYDQATGQYDRPPWRRF
ncbi:G1 family glutamic endopeptidase [Solirubrobacter soli]|uniref:G1 family glutamic endopeptidase n=1 Tax=Solirubrobacter soli TaxID=363832 RepID=UPI00040B72A0|nr:G1 family glutamic endopeptidase [Solirubrobacter soli]